MAAVLSIVFLIYVLSTVPQRRLSTEITNLGIESAGHFYRWEELVEFWMEEQWGQYILVLRPYFGARIILLLGEAGEADGSDVLWPKHSVSRDTRKRHG